VSVDALYDPSDIQPSADDDRVGTHRHYLKLLLTQLVSGNKS
jgi:hypothetical protein